MVKALLPLQVRGALTRRRGKVLVGPVDLDIAGQGTSVVIGPNGAGKTSLLRMLHGIARLGGGQIHWACGDDEARRRQGFVFQQPIMMRRSVLGNLAYPLQLDGVTRAEANNRAADWAERVGLGHALGQSAPSLSGGERQKLALARVLIRGPEVLFLDEPCASLDGAATRDIEAILTEAVADGTRLIMSTHDMGQAARLADEVLFLHKGQVLEQAPAEQFFKGPSAAEAQAFLRGDIVE